MCTFSKNLYYRPRLTLTVPILKYRSIHNPKFSFDIDPQHGSRSLYYLGCYFCVKLYLFEFCLAIIGSKAVFIQKRTKNRIQYSDFLPVNVRLPVNARLTFLCERSRTNASINPQNGRSLIFPVCGKNGR